MKFLTYGKTITVTQDDLDALQHVNNVRYVEWIQKISEAHWQEVTQHRYDQSFIWVVRKHAIIYLGAAKLNDVVSLSTYIKSSRGAISTRFVEIKNNKTGQLLVTAVTDWCLLDAKTQKPRRIPKAIENLFRPHEEDF